MKQLIFINGWPSFGFSTCYVERPDHFRGWPVYSQVFVCPFDGAVWARVGDPPYQAIAIPCEYHPQYSHPILSPVPGSILDNRTFAGEPDWDLLVAMSLGLLEREFELHIKALELDSHEQPTTSSTPGDITGDPVLDCQFLGIRI